MIKKLSALFDKAVSKIRGNRGKYKKLNKLRKKYKAEIQALVGRLSSARDELNEVERDLAYPAVQKDPIRKKQLTKQRRELSALLDRLNASLELAKGNRDSATAGMKRTRARVKFWIKKKTVLRSKLKKAKEEAHPKYEPWMANGYDDNITDGAKEFVARGVVHYGLTVTSLHRTYVPPGGSTTSFHLQTPSPAADIAGARMQEFQEDEYERNEGKESCYELMGPNNDKWLKYGDHMSIGEGDPLENLHDTHVHGAFA